MIGDKEDFLVKDLLELKTKESVHLKLKCIAGRRGLFNKITVPDINRPGFALSGFFTNFASERIQLFGKGEVGYLEKMLNDLKPVIHEKTKVLCLLNGIGHEEVIEQFVPKENIFLMLNGDILEINEKGARCQTRISAPDVNVDTNNTSIDTALLWERKVLSTEGVVGINIAIDENGLLMRPELFTRGIAELDRNSKKADNIIKEVERKIDLFIINNKNYQYK